MRAFALSCVAAVVVVAAGCGEEAVAFDRAAVVDEASGEVIDGVAVADVDGVAADPAPLGPPYPIVLVHGFSGFTQLENVFALDYFYGVTDALSADGNDVTAPALPPFNSSRARAIVLGRVVDDVLARTHKQKVHLIAHSQGGIDARTLITELGYADKVASVTTISTPHRGTSLANLANYVSDDIITPAGAFLGWLLGNLQGDPSTEEEWRDDEEIAAAYDPDLVAAIDNLKPATMETWNAAHPDPIGVPIFSVAGISNLQSLDHPYCSDGVWGHDGGTDAVDPIFAASGLMLSLSDGGDVFNPSPNDGVVSVASARWGIFLGCVAADHADEVGLIADQGTLASGFNHLDFYRRLVAHLRTIEQ